MSNNKQAFYDIPELKEQIRKLKARRLELNAEKSQLELDLQELDKKALTLRSEINVLGAFDDAKYEDNSDGNKNEEDVALDKKFYEANRKLEISILNVEIRNALPNLEKEALACEEIAFRSERILKQSELEHKSLPDLYLYSQSEIASEVAKLSESKNSMKRNIYICRGNHCLYINLFIMRPRKHIQ